MTEPSSSLSPESSYASLEAFLAELDAFVRRVQLPERRQADDAQRLHALLAQAESYMQAGHYEVAATAYERLLAIMRQFETTTPPDDPTAVVTDEHTLATSAQADSESPMASQLAAPAETEAPAAALEAMPESASLLAAWTEPPAAPSRAASTPTRRRIVHVERKKIRPYRSPEAGASTPEVDEIQRAPAPADYRPLAAIPTTTGGRPPALRRWRPLLVILVIVAGTALAGLAYRDPLMGLLGLGNAQTPTSVAAPGRSATVATHVPAGRTPTTVKLPTNVVTTHIAPTSTFSASVSVGTDTPASTATYTVAPSITSSPTLTPTPEPTETPTNTPTVTPPPTPVMVFTGPDPLAGTTGVVLYETFEPRAYYWGVGETGFSLTRIKNGALEINLKSRNAVVWLFAGVPDMQDFFAMITVTSPNCDGSDHFGLNFRAFNDGTQFQFGVTCDGRYRLLERQTGEARLLVGPTPSDAIKPGPGAVNELGVRGEGTQISLYVNRQFLTRVDLNALTKGRFGAYANSAATPNLTAQFDNFIVWGMQAP